MNEIPVTILKQGDDISITEKHILVIGGVSIWTAMSQKVLPISGIWRYQYHTSRYTKTNH